MRSGETELEMVERHVAAGQKVIDNQRVLIARLDAVGASTLAAQTILATFFWMHKNSIAIISRGCKPTRVCKVHKRQTKRTK